MIICLRAPFGHPGGTAFSSAHRRSPLVRRPIQQNTLRLTLAARPRLTQPSSSRRGFVCRAHGSHSHGSDHSHSHEHHEDHHHHHDHNHSCCGSHSHHDHGGRPIPGNPVHNILKAVYDGLRLTPLAAWLDSSMFSSIAKIIMFAVAALASWASGRSPLPTDAAFLHQVSVAATAVVFFFAGIPAALQLSYDVTAGHIDTHVLMNLAVVGTLVTGYPLEGALLLVLFQTSHVVEHLLTDKAQGNLQALYDAVPDTAALVDLDSQGAPLMGSLRHVSASEVGVDDCMWVKPGEQVPLDGVIVHGRALVSAEHITGESLPALRRPGDLIPAGALCHDGALTIRASTAAEDSTPARIARLTANAQAQRPKVC